MRRFLLDTGISALSLDRKPSFRNTPLFPTRENQPYHEICSRTPKLRGQVRASSGVLLLARPQDGHRWLEFINIGEDSLTAFTAEFLALLSERSVHVEEPFYLMKYAFPPGSDPVPTSRIDFPLVFPPPSRVPLWREADDIERNSPEAT